MKSIALLLTLSCVLRLSSQGQEAYLADTAQYLAPVKKELNAVWPANRTINLVFHGHSVVAGYQDKHEVHTFESYPYLLLKKLKEKYPYAVINVIVTAIGGENSLHGQELITQDGLIDRPNFLYVGYTLNDL